MNKPACVDFYCPDAHVTIMPYLRFLNAPLDLQEVLRSVVGQIIEVEQT